MGLKPTLNFNSSGGNLRVKDSVKFVEDLIMDCMTLWTFGEFITLKAKNLLGVKKKNINSKKTGLLVHKRFTSRRCREN